MFKPSLQKLFILQSCAKAPGREMRNSNKLSGLGIGHGDTVGQTKGGTKAVGHIEQHRIYTTTHTINVTQTHDFQLQFRIYLKHIKISGVISAAARAVKHEDVIEQVKKYFTKLSSNPITTSQLVAENPAIFTGLEICIIDDDLPLAQFAVAFSGASWKDPDSIALMVMQQMLGSWNKTSGGGKHMGSKLVQRVAINELAESVMSFNTNYKDTGLFGVYAEAKPDCLSDLAYVIMNGMCKLSYKVSNDDVVRARNQI